MRDTPHGFLLLVPMGVGGINALPNRYPQAPMTSPSSAALLEVSGVTVRFGGITALDQVSFSVMPATIAGLIGPNGAGKTTLFNCLSRLYTFSEGRILFEGRSLTDSPAHRIAALGIGRTFQNLALFRTMSVWHNVMLGGHCRSSSGFLSNALRLPHVQREEESLSARAAQAIDMLDLGPVAQTPVADLPFGTQKRVELARALMSQPKLLLLDEPAGGLNHEEVEELGRFIVRTRDDYELTVLLVEHHMNLVMGISDQVHVMNFGKMIAEGAPDEVRANPAVIEAYLGTDEAPETPEPTDAEPREEPDGAA